MAIRASGAIVGKRGLLSYRASTHDGAGVLLEWRILLISGIPAVGTPTRNPVAGPGAGSRCTTRGILRRAARQREERDEELFTHTHGLVASGTTC